MNQREHKYFEQGLLEGEDLRGRAAASVHIYAQGLGEVLGISESEALHFSRQDYRHRLDSLPSTGSYPELAGMRECVLAYNRGLAQATGVTEEDIWVMRNHISILTRQWRLRVETSPQRIGGADEPGCTLVYFPHSDRGPLWGNNVDDPYRPGFLADPIWPVANRAGLVMGTVSNGIFGDEISPELFPAPVFLMVYELCETADEAVELLTRLNLFWGPCNLLVADRYGNSAVIEKSSCRYGVRRSENGFSATTAMAAEEPAYKEYLWQTRDRSIKNRGLDYGCVDWAYWLAAQSRSSRLLGMLKKVSQASTYAEMEAILYDHTGEPDQICLDGGKCHPDEEVTNWTVRVVLHVLNENRSVYSLCEPPLGAHEMPRLTKEYPPAQLVF